jgi:hypothetical protein
MPGHEHQKQDDGEQQNSACYPICTWGGAADDAGRKGGSGKDTRPLTVRGQQAQRSRLGRSQFYGCCARDPELVLYGFSGGDATHAVAPALPHSDDLHFTTVDEPVEAEVDLRGQNQFARSIATPQQPPTGFDEPVARQTG